MTVILEVNILVKKNGLGYAGHTRPGAAAAGFERCAARGGGAAGLCRGVLYARDIALQVGIGTGRGEALPAGLLLVCHGGLNLFIKLVY